MSNGWIAVDLDRTLAHYYEWPVDGSVGDPIPDMLNRVKMWLADGKDVRIFTARVAASGLPNKDSGVDSEQFAADQRAIIQEWCVKYIGHTLPVTATKDLGMYELWDDRAIQMIPNTGMTLNDFAKAQIDTAEAESERLLALINSPQTSDWMESVKLEAAFQVEKWGTDDREGKTPSDWFWLIGYLAGKALASFLKGDRDKGMHHIISTSAVLLNWHRCVTGEMTRMRPGAAREKVPA